MAEDSRKPGALFASDDGFADLGSTDTFSLNKGFHIRAPIWRPPTDVYETEDCIVVRVEIAGMQDDDFVIELDRRYLTIRGIRPDVPERRAYHQMEIPFGEFNIELELAFHIDTERVQAIYSNGFLKVVLPKARPRQILIED